MRRASLIISLLGLFVLGAPLSASAQSPFPLEYSERPLTINQGMFAIDAGILIEKIQVMTPTGNSDPRVSIDAAVAYGVTDDFEVGAVPVHLGLSPDSKFGNPTLYAEYRFLKTAVELGAYLGIEIPVEDGSNFALTLGIPALFGLTSTTKIVTGVYLPILFADSTIVSLSIPIEFAVNFTPQLFLNIFTGVNMFDLNPDLLSVPLGVGVGYTLAASADRPLADISVRFTFPTFLNALGDTVVTDSFQVLIGARFFLN